MVLCASNSDHTDVKLLVPPDNAVAGDRITFMGFIGEPLPPNQIAKKKVFEKLAPMVSCHVVDMHSKLVTLLFIDAD